MKRLMMLKSLKAMEYDNSPYPILKMYKDNLQALSHAMHMI